MKDSPHKIAGGFALGVYVGVMPGLGTIAAVIIASLLKLNRVAAILGTIVFNSVTQIPIWIFSYSFGSLVLGKGWSDSEQITQLVKSGKYLRAFIEGGTNLVVGFFIVSLILGLISYLLVYKLMLIYQNNKRTRLSKRN